MDVTTIGLDLAKSVFQVHGVDAAGQMVVRRQLRRRQVLPFFKILAPCLVGLEDFVRQTCLRVRDVPV
jgi:transposase